MLSSLEVVSGSCRRACFFSCGELEPAGYAISRQAVAFVTDPYPAKIAIGQYHDITSYDKFIFRSLIRFGLVKDGKSY
uniref:Uncharacterized protein n=1 Tax=uncultured marine crenarchaeote HF4000_APKG8D22 TaxID=455603 RepID=B3TAB3_9ARCH|nr:hypothetical protein ALOHA_HF4000APKG8D22ctg11g2 [uncultured marine crenarchaeote HF4000_APKG8D22]